MAKCPTSQLVPYTGLQLVVWETILGTNQHESSDRLSFIKDNDKRMQFSYALGLSFFLIRATITCYVCTNRDAHAIVSFKRVISAKHAVHL